MPEVWIDTMICICSVRGKMDVILLTLPISFNERFNENLPTGAELLFIVNAVMLCSEILFMTESFYIAPKI